MVLPGQRWGTCRSLLRAVPPDADIKSRLGWLDLQDQQRPEGSVLGCGEPTVVYFDKVAITSICQPPPIDFIQFAMQIDLSSDTFDSSTWGISYSPPKDIIYISLHIQHSTDFYLIQVDCDACPWLYKPVTRHYPVAAWQSGLLWDMLEIRDFTEPWFTRSTRKLEIKREIFQIWRLCITVGWICLFCLFTLVLTRCVLVKLIIKIILSG